jgi:Ca2+-binding EF-hand superfamily protein
VDDTNAWFDRIDTNRDGYLSRGELAPHGVVTGVPAPIESAAAAFDRLDTNRDGFLSPLESGNVFAPVPGGSFAAFDSNRDGFLTRSEAIPHLQWLESRHAANGISFEAFDRNADGFLSRSEAAPLLRDSRMAARRPIGAPLAANSFERWDLDRDGFLSRTEAAAALGPLVFDQYDSNRDGFLSRGEVEPALASGVGTTGASTGATVSGPRY